jgi:flagellar FliJ protein
VVSASNSLFLAIQMAKKTRDGFAAQFKRCKQSMSNAQGQMDQLCSYAGETHEKWILVSQVGVSPEIMRHQIQFMARLQEAIGLQRSVLQDIDTDTQRVHKNYRDSELRLASLEHMQKKRRSNLDALQIRREQKQTDEFAATRKITIFESV